MNSEETEKSAIDLFSHWFNEEEYGSWGGTRSLYFFDEVKSGVNASRLRTWLEAAFQTGYEQGRLSAKND